MQHFLKTRGVNISSRGVFPTFLAFREVDSVDAFGKAVAFIGIGEQDHILAVESHGVVHFNGFNPRHGAICLALQKQKRSCHVLDIGDR